MGLFWFSEETAKTYPEQNENIYICNGDVMCLLGSSAEFLNVILMNFDAVVKNNEIQNNNTQDWRSVLFEGH
jgi:hypothetical protein